MLNLKETLTGDELAELSNEALNECIRSALFQWNEALKEGKSTTELEHIFHAYDTEQLNRLKRLNMFLKP